MSTMKSPGRILAMSCLLALAAGCAASSVGMNLMPAAEHPAPFVAPADLLILDGRIFTGDEQQPWAEALAVRGDRVLAVGSRAEVEALAGLETRRIEVGGRLVIPGINDAHVHSGLTVEATALRGVGPGTSTGEMLDSLAVHAARAPHGHWLRGAVGPAILLDPRATRLALDGGAPDHPVYLLSFVGHGILLNSAGVHALRLGEGEREPFGGWYGRGPGEDLRSGLLHGYAGFAVRRQLSLTRSDADQIASLQGFARGMVELGITSAQDMPSTGAAHLLRWLEAAKVPVRWRVIDFPFSRHAGPHDSPLASGLKWIVEGTPIEGGVLTRRAYGDRAGYHGSSYIPLDALPELLRDGLAGGRQLLLHVAGDSSWAALLTSMEAVAPDSVWRSRRLRVEHGDNLAPDQYAAVRRLGIVVVQNPSHLDHPELMRERYPDRVADYQPLRSLVEAGIPLALGSDGPLSPYLNIMWAAAHANNPAEALTVEQALVAYTRGSAYAEFAEQRKGTLEPGMLADLAVLSQDIFVVPLPELPNTRALLTMVGGRVVHDALENQ
jgi:predicted amidohydrolase YtcJ